MTVIAYASSDVAPLANPDADPIIDLSSSTVSLPQLAVVNAAAIDDAPSAGPFSFQWYVMAKPEGSIAALDDSTLSSPTLEDIDIWGNYRLFVIATNTATNETSQVDPLRAPSSAFVVVRVLSENKQIQKPAAGERNWFDDIYAWADAIENFSGVFVKHDIIDHEDNDFATGPDLEQLVLGSYADDPESDPSLKNAVDAYGNRPLHKHHGGDIDIATTAIPGVLLLDPTFTGNPLAPTAMTQDSGFVSAHAFWTIDSQYGLVDRISEGPVIENEKAPLFVWHLPPGVGNVGTSFNWEILTYGVHFNQANAEPEQYTFDLVKGDEVNPLDITSISGSSFIMRTLDSSSQLGFQHWSDWSAVNSNGVLGTIGQINGSTHWLGFRITNAPASLEDRARGITVTIYMKRA